eukprot:3940533-Amphidinium_carterae.2
MHFNSSNFYAFVGSLKSNLCRIECPEHNCWYELLRAELGQAIERRHMKPVWFESWLCGSLMTSAVVLRVGASSGRELCTIKASSPCTLSRPPPKSRDNSATIGYIALCCPCLTLLG